MGFIGFGGAGWQASLYTSLDAFGGASFGVEATGGASLITSVELTGNKSGSPRRLVGVRRESSWRAAA